jgi:sporulation protein YlmC with PRC-barrel domain
MLRFVDQIIGQPILGIRGGRELARVVDIVLNPHKMRIEAFFCDDRRSQEDLVLHGEDIREFGALGIIVDSEDSIMPLGDLVRLKEIVELNFSLIDKAVVTESGKKLGKVENYVVDDNGFNIEKIYARPQLLKAFGTSDFIIGRRQIVRVNNNEVVVKDPTETDKSRERKPSLLPV